jgi:polyhydroxyalkanoate synthase
MPWREVHCAEGMRLRVYGKLRPGPVLLLVPAPIKRAYIWDLAPGRSVVRHALAEDFNVGLIEWTEPEGENVRSLGLGDYAERLIGTAVDALSGMCGSREVLLVGHSLGGTLATLFATLRSEQVRGLVLIEAPLRFGLGGGALGALAAAAPYGPEVVRVAFDMVPGSLTSALGITADPVEFLPARWLDALASAADLEAFATHLRVLRWTLDELAMPGQLFEEVAGQLLRDDAFSRGALEIVGRPAAPGLLGMPVLAVLDPLSRLVPPRSVLPVLADIGGPTTVLRYREEEPGAALPHVGALVGRAAHRRLWPQILRWMREVWEAGGDGRPHPSCSSTTYAGGRSCGELGSRNP